MLVSVIAAAGLFLVVGFNYIFWDLVLLNRENSLHTHYAVLQ